MFKQIQYLDTREELGLKHGSAGILQRQQASTWYRFHLRCPLENVVSYALVYIFANQLQEKYWNDLGKRGLKALLSDAEDEVRSLVSTYANHRLQSTATDLLSCPLIIHLHIKTI